jgi:serine/threonine protein kinase
MYSMPGGDVLVDLNENSICYCIASSTLRLYSGHVESLIRGRDFDTLSILETFQGHQDIVYSLCVDVNGVLYSASFDGSIKRWDTASRKIAFSFENRNASVISLAASENFLFVGTKSGVVNIFKIDTAAVVHSAYYHQKAVTSLIAYNDRLYSSGLDGYVLEFSSIKGPGPIILYSDTQAQIRSIARTLTKILLIRDDTEIIILPLNKSSGIAKTITSSSPVSSIAANEMFVLAGSKSGLILAWSLEDLQPVFEFKGHTAQVNFLLVDQDNLYSASNDKTIIQWSLETFNFIRTLKRYSSSALGHLGPINSLSICRGALFSAGSDITTRRWNTQTGRHEGVYFGASKSVSSVTCYNGSVFSGSDDFSVLMYKPILSEERPVATTTTRSFLNPRSRKGAKTVRKENSKVSESSQPIFLTIGIVAGVVIIVFMAAIFLSIYGKSKDKTPSSPTTVTNTMYGFSNASDLETVVNSVMGISKHAAFLIESSLIAQEKRIAKGGGGELFIAKVMSPALKKKAGETVIQKVVFIKKKSNEEAFYQEVGIMIMLSTYPHFCQIIGYTENPLSMILKYYPDGSLSDWLRKGRISKTAAVIVLKEIAEALNVMHTHYLAHCDIKPQNVLIEEVDGVPSCFLTDFGITQVLSDKIVASRMFNVINLRGLSVSYASPEAFKNFRAKKYVSVDFKAYDIYSFACIAYELLSRRMPWYKS